MKSNDDSCSSVTSELPTSELSRRFTSGAAWSMGFQISRQLLSIVSVSVLARRVPPSAYGLLSMATIFANFIDIFRDLGTWSAIVREREISARLLSSVFWVNLGLGFLLTLSMAAVSFPAAAFFHQPELAPVMQALALVPFIYSISVIPNALLNRQMGFRALAVVQLAGAVAGTVSAVVAALHSWGVWSLVLAALVSNSVTSAALWIAHPWLPRFIIDRREIARIRSYSLNLAGFNFVNYFSRNADNLIVGRFLGDVQLGFYQMAYTLMTYPLANFCQVIAGVAYPAFSALQNDDERLRAAYTRVSVTVGFFSIPAMFGLMVVADPFVRVVLGQKWAPVTGLVLIFAPLGALQSIYGLVGAIYNAKGRSDRLFQWSLMSGGFYVISFFVGVRWGIQGVAIAYSIAWLVGMVPGFLIPFRLIHLSGREFLRAMWPGAACAAAMGLIALVWRLALSRLGFHNPAVHLFTTVAVGVISYAALMWWWNPPVVEEVCDVLASRGLSRLTPLISRRRWAAAKSGRMSGDY